jgi:hypothetical protein
MGPQSPDVYFRPLILNPSRGYYINILRFAVLESSHGIATAARSTPLRYAAGGGISNTTGRHPLGTMRSSHPARHIPWSFLKTFRKWRRCFTWAEAIRMSTPTAWRWATRTFSRNLKM